MTGYKKFKGWNGTVYWVKMSDQEIRERELLKLLIAVPAGALAFVFGCAVAAGMIIF